MPFFSALGSLWSLLRPNRPNRPPAGPPDSPVGGDGPGWDERAWTRLQPVRSIVLGFRALVALWVTLAGLVTTMGSCFSGAWTRIKLADADPAAADVTISDVAISLPMAFLSIVGTCTYSLEGHSGIRSVVVVLSFISVFSAVVGGFAFSSPGIVYRVAPRGRVLLIVDLWGPVAGGIGFLVALETDLSADADASLTPVLVCQAIAALAIILVARTSLRRLPVSNDARTGNDIDLERQDP